MISLFPNLFPSFGNLCAIAVSNLPGTWWGWFGAFSSVSREASDRSLDRIAERRLIEEALQGDDGFNRLAAVYERFVYRVAFRFVGNEEDAMDVSQETFLRIHRALPGFRGDSSLSTWIYTVTANLARNSLRSKKSRERVQVLAPDEKGPEGEPRSFWDRVADPKEKGAARETESRDLGRRIQEALLLLPEDFREAVMLRDMEDMDYQDIAALLGIELGTVKSRIARGRAMLRETLKDELG
jgi:RNA polymerase sigma-70 factor (ECF subfamily)